MKNVILRVGCAFSFAAVALGATQADAACPSQQVIFLFDQSNSMNWNGTDGQPKYTRVQARSQADYAKTPDDAVVAVMGFGNTFGPSGELRTTPYSYTYVPITDNKTKAANNAELMAALTTGGTPSVNYNTPLAGATCDSVDIVKNFNTTCAMQSKRIVYLYTDGAENSTPDGSFPGSQANPCYSADSSGPDHTFNASMPTADFGLLPHTWEWNIAMKAYCNNLVTGCNTISMPDPLRPVFNVTVFFDWVNRLTTPSNGIDGAPASANQQALDAASLALFAGLAQVSGGSYSDTQKVGGVAPVDPVPGDTDPAANRSCVEQADLDRILEVYGRSVVYGDPQWSWQDLSMRDVTDDGVIDISDYYLAAQNYGICHLP